MKYKSVWWVAQVPRFFISHHHHIYSVIPHQVLIGFVKQFLPLCPIDCAFSSDFSLPFVLSGANLVFGRPRFLVPLGTFYYEETTNWFLLCSLRTVQ